MQMHRGIRCPLAVGLVVSILVAVDLLRPPDPDPTTAVTALCAILGLGLSFLDTSIALGPAIIGPAISGAVGAVSLLFMKSRLDDQIVKQGRGMLQVNYETGFSLALLLMLAGAAWNAYLFLQRPKAGPARPPSEPPPSPERTGSQKSPKAREHVPVVGAERAA